MSSTNPLALQRYAAPSLPPTQIAPEHPTSPLGHGFVNLELIYSQQNFFEHFSFPRLI